MPYFTEQRVWMVQEYHRTKNAHQTSRNFQKKFNIPAPSPHTILSLVKKFAETGNIANRGKKRRPTVLTSEKIEEIRNLFTQNPTISVRKGANVLNIGVGSVHRALHKLGMHPYKAIKTQKLLPNDHHLRLQFAYKFINMCKNTEKNGRNF
jgi:transposase